MHHQQTARTDDRGVCYGTGQAVTLIPNRPDAKPSAWCPECGREIGIQHRSNPPRLNWHRAVVTPETKRQVTRRRFRPAATRSEFAKSWKRRQREQVSA